MRPTKLAHAINNLGDSTGLGHVKLLGYQWHRNRFVLWPGPSERDPDKRTRPSGDTVRYSTS